MQTPEPCGPLSRLVVSHLRAGPGPTVTSRGVGQLRRLVDQAGDPLHDRDLQLALACCYELHYGGFDDVADDLEWDPTTLALAGLLERAMESALRTAVTHDGLEGIEPAEVPARLRSLVDQDAEADTGPSLSAFLLRDAADRHFRAFLAQRSVYHLKEADPHTWVIPRLRGRAKAALVEIQADEYGGGRPAAMHSSLFAATMRALGLDDSYGSYWADATAETFASVNVMTLFGLHRRLRGAALGHLAALEMTSTLPNRRYGNGLRRLGHDVTATAYFDEHVEADAVHEQVASVDLCGSFAQAEPALAGDVLWGAACCLMVDRLAGAALLSAWGRETTETTADPVGEVA